MKLSPGAKAVILTAAVIGTLVALIAANYFIAQWRANAVVQQSQQQLCQIVNLVTRTPVPKPPDPKANPSRESSYEFYMAFVILGREYHC